MLYNVYCFTLHTELDNIKYSVESVIRYSIVSSKRENKQYTSTSGEYNMLV